MPERRTVAIALPNTGEEEWQALRAPLARGWLTQGAEVLAFEQAFAARHGVASGVATSSGTTALHAVLAALDVGPGDEVIVPAFTWVATANAVVYCGARPVLVDIDPHTFNMDARAVGAALTARTRAIVAVHLFGLPADLAAIRAAAPGVPIVEDAACAAGASYAGRPVGGLARAAAFSFHPRKAITTGEGGMVTTDDLELAARVRELRSHGSSTPAPGAPAYRLPDVALLGFNYRMTDLQAAIGRVQLGKLDAFIEERRRLARRYDEALANVRWLRRPVAPDGYGHVWQSYVCWVDPGSAPAPRDGVMEALEREGIATRVGTHALNLLTFYRNRFGVRPDDFPVARDAAAQSLAIPLHNRMSEADVDYVASRLAALS
jgi:dTDP-4-amino-4,6-dideoxygalactose transaminase